MHLRLDHILNKLIDLHPLVNQGVYHSVNRRLKILFDLVYYPSFEGRRIRAGERGEREGRERRERKKLREK